MKQRHWLGAIAGMVVLVGVVGCGDKDSEQERAEPQRAEPPTASQRAPSEQVAPQVPPAAQASADTPLSGAPAGEPPPTPAAEAGGKAPAYFTPPLDIPDNEFGRLVRMGEQIFTDTPTHAKEFAGNGLSCANCHMDAGRHPNSSPLWGAYPNYPAFRKKTGKVDTYQARLQGCFMYSMDGTAPPADSEVMNALVAYSHWMSQGVPIGEDKIDGRGYPELPKPQQAPSPERGAQVFETNCALCHGADGQGQKASDGRYAFPPLWGPDSFNWGAGMHRVNTGAAFIKANMPLGKGGSLTDQEAWDVSAYMNHQPRPQDPRFNGDVAETDAKHHDEQCYYGDAEALPRN